MIIRYLSILFLLSFNIVAEAQVDKPNIIIVITDDQGKNDLACEGNPYVITPNIDKFYEKAIRLTNFHVSTTCAPSRGAIMTGRHTNRINTFHTISGRSLLFDDERILPQVFAENGYTNGMFGKWHLGDNYPYRPMDRGFHEVVRHGGGGISQGPDYWQNDYFDDTYWHNGTPTKYEGYCTDVFFNEAINFIEKNHEDPFFCYISTNAPHGPLNCPEEYIAKYNKYDIDERYKRFYGMITNIDDNFKLLQDKLEELNITDNTILIFMTDNGSATGRGLFNPYLRGGKGSQYEGGHRVPFYIHWPNGKLEGGKDIDQLIAHYDLLPTFVDLLGLKFTPVKPLDGTSIKNLLQGNNKDWKNRILYMDTQRTQNLVKYKSYTVMDEKWRLVDGDELYDVTTDLKQEHNIIENNPEVAARLAQGYEYWWQSFVDEGVNERYAYIKVGTQFENPVRLSAHDMLTGKLSLIWHQYGATKATPAYGKWKIDFVTGGKYKIALRRFPRSSNLAINEVFPATEKPFQLEQAMPASIKSDFSSAFLNVANISKTKSININDQEIVFEVNIPEGKFDFEAILIDNAGVFHPAYYVYIEKLSAE